jgi:hypothetical protein
MYLPKLGRRSASRRWRDFTALITLGIVLIAGCGVGGIAQVGQEAEQIVQQAIDELNRQPSEWSQTMQNTIDNLKKSGSDLLNQIQDLYNSSIGQAENITFCTADFIGHRVSEQMQKILHKIDSTKPEPALWPVICHTNPPEKITAGTTTVLVLYGYNLKDFARQATYQARLEYANGDVITPNFGHINLVSDYQIEDEFQAADFTNLDRTRGPRLALTWMTSNVRTDGSGVSSALPIILPAPPRTSHEDFTVNVHADNFGQCKTIDYPYRLSGGWTIDRTKGDPDHPGISQIRDDSNQQAKDTLRGDNYQPESDDSLRVTGTICGSKGWGAGAIFNRTYRVFMLQQ